MTSENRNRHRIICKNMELKSIEIMTIVTSLIIICHTCLAYCVVDILIITVMSTRLVSCIVALQS